MTLETSTAVPSLQSKSRRCACEACALHREHRALIIRSVCVAIIGSTGGWWHGPGLGGTLAWHALMLGNVIWVALDVRKQTLWLDERIRRDEAELRARIEGLS